MIDVQTTSIRVNPVPADQGILVFDPTNQRYYDFDVVAAMVWDLTQQPRTLDEIRDEILKHFDVEADRCERDLAYLLRQMQAEGLIEEALDDC
jgi:hypothetical protein